MCLLYVVQKRKGKSFAVKTCLCPCLSEFSWVAGWPSYRWTRCWARWSWPPSSKSPVWEKLATNLVKKNEVVAFASLCIFSIFSFNFLLSASFQVQVFKRSVDDSGHAVGEQLYLLPAQRQGGARRQRQNELCGARGRPPGAAQRLHTGKNMAGWQQLEPKMCWKYLEYKIKCFSQMGFNFIPPFTYMRGTESSSWSNTSGAVSNNQIFRFSLIRYANIWCMHSHVTSSLCS